MLQTPYSPYVRLIDRFPQLTAADLAARFVPPSRFHDVSFGSYVVDPAHASQQQAVTVCSSFAATAIPAAKQRFWRRTSLDDGKAGLYLDGAFGVGKTHLLASIWNAHAGAKKTYLTFTELTAFIGFAGMPHAIETLSRHELLCIDEFELDDVANTLMVVTFLREYLTDGRQVAVTSNTIPGKLGEDRFSASEFKREIAVIAGFFDEFRIDGADYRTSHVPLPLADHSLDYSAKTTHDSFDELMTHLRKVHPAQFSALFDGVDAVQITGLHPVTSQDDALRIVHFVDKLYDAKIPTNITGCEVAQLFESRYRNGGYSKKYGRAESRLTAMIAESAGVLGPSGPQ